MWMSNDKRILVFETRAYHFMKRVLKGFGAISVPCVPRQSCECCLHFGKTSRLKLLLNTFKRSHLSYTSNTMSAPEVNNSLKEASLETLRSILSANHEVRKAGESQVQALEVTEGIYRSNLSDKLK